MRVLYVNQTAQVSGAERSLLALLKGVTGAVEPVLACPAGELADAASAIGVRHVPIRGTDASFRLHPVHTARGLAEVASLALQIRSLVARVAPDLVHANTTRASLVALLARHRAGPPVVAHIRDRALDGRFQRVVLGLIGRRADAVVANSAFVAAQFDGMSLHRPAQVIYNPVDLDLFNPGAVDGAAVRCELGVPAGSLVLSVVAQLTPLKGQDHAIEALAGLVESGCDAMLLLVGSAKFAAAGAQLDNVAFERRLHALAGESGVGARVRFLGERGDVPDILAATDIALMPFWRDGFGRVAIEAMALGVPVVAADVGGPAEVVSSEVDGMLLPVGDAGTWLEGLSRLAADSALRASMGRRGMERAADFRVEAHAAEVLALYSTLAG